MGMFDIPWAGKDHREVLRDAGDRLHESVHLSWTEYEALLRNIALSLRLSDYAVGMAIGWHRDYHEKLWKSRIGYVRGELRQRHKLVVPMVVKARPTFKKARTGLDSALRIRKS